MVFIFVVGYACIALEHPFHVDKAGTAMLTGILVWTVYMLGSSGILDLGYSPSFTELKTEVASYMSKYTNIAEAPAAVQDKIELLHSHSHFIKHELLHHLIEIAEILFFLLGAMTIVEVVDQNEGFKPITDKIKSTNKVKLLWIIAILTFFMSAALDNLTSTIVLIALLRKLIADKKTRWLYASVVVLAANSGGAWSPIGDVTTIMLWNNGQVTASNIIAEVILPSLVSIIVPVGILSFTLKGNVTRPEVDPNEKTYNSPRERKIILFVGLSCLLFVPVFKNLTHLPPYTGMILGLSVIWILTDLMHKNKSPEAKTKSMVFGVLKKIDTATIFFFLGILTAVSALQSAGHLAQLAGWLDNATNNNIYIINVAIGILSSIVDNVPLVAGAMGMYPVTEVGDFMVDGNFWEFLAYCAGTGGSILIIGSAAGVAAMGLEKIDFIWYLKKISLLALAGYLAGAATFYFINA